MSERYSPWVFCAGPGVLRGVFTAGGGEGLVRQHLAASPGKGVFDALRAIHASSAGVPSTLFLALASHLRDMELGIAGADIYTEDLTGTRFLNVHRIPGLYLHSFRRFFSETVHHPPPVVDIDYLMRRIRQKLPPDFQEHLRALPFEYDAHVFNRVQQCVETVSLKTAEDPLRVVRESITAIPGTIPSPEQVHVDAAVAEGLFDHERIREQYPQPIKIVYFANYPPIPDGRISYFREWLTHLLYGYASIRDGVGPETFKESFLRIQDQVQAIRADAYALLVCPPQWYSLRATTELSTLTHLRREGGKQTQKALHFLRAS